MARADSRLSRGLAVAWGWPRLLNASAAMKSTQVVRNYYVLPCCLLLLNLCVELVSYKARMFGNPVLRTAAIMGMVLFGGSFVGFVVAPAINVLIGGLHHSSRRRA